MTQAADQTVTIRLRDDGPLVIEGTVRVVDAARQAFVLPEDRPVVALCRCGASGDKPFCDGSHRQTGFQCHRRASEASP